MTLALLRAFRTLGRNRAIRFVLLALFEASLFILSAYLAAELRFPGGEAEAQASLGSVGPKAALFSLVMTGSIAALGLYYPGFREGLIGLMERVAVAFVMGMVVLSALFYAVPDAIIGRGVLALALTMSLLGMTAMRTVFVLTVDQEPLKRRVLVLGTGHKAALINKRMRRKSDRRGFQIVGYRPIPGAQSVVASTEILDDGPSLPRLVKEMAIDEIVVAADERRNGLPIQELFDCKLDGIRVLELARFFEKESGKIMLELVDPSWLIFSSGFRRGWWRAGVKRLVDVAGALLLLLLTWPVAVLTAVAIAVESRGPILFRQARVGARGRLFQTLKFRSMQVDAEADGVARWAHRGDDRVTKVGAVIRKLRIDELPQIVNVLRGDMSFVGPRPERPEFVEQLCKSIPYYGERHRVKPGLTGWAQIRYPYGASQEDAREKLQFDLYYAKNHSLLLDLYIIMETVEVVVFGKGAR